MTTSRSLLCLTFETNKWKTPNKTEEVAAHHLYRKCLKGVTNTVGGFEINSYLSFRTDIVIDQIIMTVYKTIWNGIHPKNSIENEHFAIINLSRPHADGSTFFPVVVSMFR